MISLSKPRVELSCHTYYSSMDGILSPQDWINIAWESGFRALAITDFQDVQAFWKAAKVVESLRREAEPETFDFKVLYGLETVLEDGCLIHLLVQNQAGLEQLYRLLEIARQDRERPFLRKTEISAHRNGLLIGCPGMDGEVFRGIEDHLDDDSLEEIGGFYDYLSVLPPCHYQQRSKPGKEFILKISALGKRLGKPVAAASNARVPDMDIFSRTAYCILKDLKQEDFVPGLLGTEEMLDSFSFLEKELAEEIVIHAPNRLADSCETICLLPEDERLLQPILPGAFETIAALCREELQIRYNGEIPVESRERLEYELTILQSSELDSSILLILYRLVHGLRRKGYLIAPRSHLPASYAVYLLGISEADPVALRISSETLFEQKKYCLLHSDFHVSEDCWEDTREIFLQMFPQGMVLHTNGSLAIGNCARTMADAYNAKYGRGWDSRFINQCAYRLSEAHRDKKTFFHTMMFLVPDAAALQCWMPVQNIDGKCGIYFNNATPRIFRLLLHHSNLILLHRLEELTGVSQSSINVEEAIPLLLRDQTDIPEFGTPRCQMIWKQANPQTMDDITKISTLNHSTNAWEGNAEELLQRGIASISEVIGSRDDVFFHLLELV